MVFSEADERTSGLEAVGGWLRSLALWDLAHQGDSDLPQPPSFAKPFLSLSHESSAQTGRAPGREK